METILKQEKSKSRLDFETQLAADMQKRSFREGEITTAIVEEVGRKFVMVDLFMKSSGAIPVSEFGKNLNKISKGDKIQVLLERIENRSGEIVVSYERAARLRSWKSVIEKYNKKEEIVAQIIQRTKGGFICEYNSVLCFLPASQLSTSPVKDVSKFMNVPFNFTIVKVDDRRKNIVLSRKECLIKIKEKDKIEKMKSIKEGTILKDCVSKSIQSWGVFYTYNKTVDLLVHVNELSWSRVSAPGDLVKIGDTSDILVHKIEGTKISGSLKRLQPDSFLEAAKKYKPGDVVEGCRVQSLKEYGAFVEIAPALVGLVHSSEIDHLNTNVRPSSVLAVSQKISVKILTIDTKERKLSLSYKDCFPSPWIAFKEKYKKNSIVNCKLKQKNDYAIFAFIEDTPIIGMLHISNLTWQSDEAEEKLKLYHKNDILKCKIYEIIDDKMKVQLSLKHMKNDPWSFFEGKSVSNVITCVVQKPARDGIWVTVGKENLSILIKKNNLAKEVEHQRNSRFNKGDRIDAMITELKKRKVTLSIKALEEREQEKIIKKYRSKDSGGILSDLFDFSKVKTKKPKSKK